MAKPRGRPFSPGNTSGSGRPPGSRNKVVVEECQGVASQPLISTVHETLIEKQKEKNNG
jgi:hypothetical protein